MKEQVLTQFDACIRVSLAKAKPAVVDFILKHERKELVIRHLMREIVKAERKRGGVLKQTTFVSLVDTVARMFAGNVLRYVEEQSISAIKRQAMIDKASEQDSFEAEQSELARDLHKLETTPRSVLAGEAFETKPTGLVDASGAPIRCTATRPDCTVSLPVMGDGDAD